MRDGREASVMSVRSLRRFSERDGWEADRTIIKSHVPHVHPRKAIIFGTLSDSADGVRVFLIEGHHRALLHLWENRDVKYYLLSREETERVTLRRRNRRKPSNEKRRGARAQEKGGSQRRASLRARRATPKRGGANPSQISDRQMNN